MILQQVKISFKKMVFKNLLRLYNRKKPKDRIFKDEIIIFLTWMMIKKNEMKK